MRVIRELNRCRNCGEETLGAYCNARCRWEYFDARRMVDSRLQVLAMLAYGRRDVFWCSVYLREPYRVVSLVAVDADGLCRLTEDGWRWLRWHFEHDRERVMRLLKVARPLEAVGSSL